MIKHILTYTLLLFTETAFSQVATSNANAVRFLIPRVTVGNLNNRVSPFIILANVDSFFRQKRMYASEGYSFKSATVYFSGDGFPYVSQADITGDCAIMTCVFGAYNLRIGTKVDFEKVKVINNKTNEIVDAESMTYIFDTTNAHLPNKDQQEFHTLKNSFYFSGNIYFSGTNFSQVYTLRLNPSLPAKYDNIFSKTTIGSVVTFENVVYINTEGSLSKPLSKTIKVTAELMDHSVIY